jgi:hypothetical protein
MIKKILDKLFFKYIIKKELITEKDTKWLRDHADHLIRICETAKIYIEKRTFTSLTLREHQRRKDWYDCLSTIQKLCSESKEKKNINWLTGKPYKPKK